MEFHQVIEKKENQRKETILETVSEEGFRKTGKKTAKLETKTPKKSDNPNWSSGKKQNRWSCLMTGCYQRGQGNIIVLSGSYLKLTG